MFFSTDPIFAADAAEKSTSEGYAFNPQTLTNTPFVSEVEIIGDNMVFAFEAIPPDVAKQIGIINGINPSKYPSNGAFIDDLKQGYIKYKVDFQTYLKRKTKQQKRCIKRSNGTCC